MSDRQGSAPYGTRAPARATAAIHATPHPGTTASAAAAPGATIASAATSEPSTVTAATTGAASTLAGTATQDTSPDRVTTTGATATCAATATARASATTPGIDADHSLVQRGTSSTMPAVASTDSAKP
ncbi:hypothetical protein SUDANB121_01724 [Nocardiopsis dassonvillei]